MAVVEGRLPGQGGGAVRGEAAHHAAVEGRLSRQGGLEPAHTAAAVEGWFSGQRGGGLWQPADGGAVVDGGFPGEGGGGLGEAAHAIMVGSAVVVVVAVVHLGGGRVINPRDASKVRNMLRVGSIRIILKLK